MKKILILSAMFVFVIFVGCKKDESIKPSNNEPSQLTGTSKNLSLVNLRDSLIGGFSLTDYFTNMDSLVCGKIDTMGKTILNLGSHCLGVFDWEAGIYCAGINPTKIEAAVFPPYSLILTENGNQQSMSQRKNLFICKNNQFSFGITINTITIKSIIYTGSSLKLTCNDSGVMNSGQPDYYVIVNL